jgi:serine/threonine protein kinase/TolB-like protein/tetratricopeptide (TPR) repeat protein
VRAGEAHRPCDGRPTEGGEVTVTGDRDYGRVERLHHAARARPPGERDAFLSQACDGDEDLLRHVKSLLADEGDARDVEPRTGAAPQHGGPQAGRSWIGRRLGNYEILAAIGSGGMGEVYRAKDLRLGRDVALKVLPEDFSRDPERVARFQREARLLAALNHPSIASIYGLEESEGRHALALELVPGETLAKRMLRGLLSPAEALSIFRQVADALEAAHEKGIIHRDLKPANVAVTPDGRVKLLDFGLAKAFTGAGPDSDPTTSSPTVSDGGTREGRILGTASYMSPEQARGQPLDERTDIWSFGCCLYEALAGRRAYAGETVPDTLAAVLDREVDWAALPEETPVSVRRLLQRCLKKDRSRRLRHIADARMEIDEALAEGPSAPGSRVATAATIRAETSAPSPRGRRLGPYAWTLVSVLVIAAAWGGWSFLRPRPPEPGKSVAVLPLVTLDSDPDGEYFGTGLTEDIVTHLSKIPNLAVASSLSSLRYRDTDKSLRQIGQELGVATLLVGKIRRQADRVRVNVELIDARTSRNLWAESFEGRMSDILGIQGEIAEKLAARLQVELSVEVGKALARAPTVDPDAYRLVLRGRYLRNRERPEDLVTAADCFEKATERDPGYAPAWAGLAEALFLQTSLHTVPESQEAALFAEATQAAEQALHLDGTLAEAHVVKGVLLANHPPGDTAGGERELRRAIELNPRLANAHRELGLLLLRTMGKVQDAVDELRLAVGLEPFWRLAKVHLVEGYLEKGDLANAVRTEREARELDGPSSGIWLTAWVTMALQDYGRGERLVEEIVEKEGAGLSGRHRLRWAALFLSLNGRAAEATALMGRLARAESDLAGPFVAKTHSTAGIAALLSGDYGAAARHLERACAMARGPVGWSTFDYSTLYLDYATLLGYARLKMGDRDRALRLLEETARYHTDHIARGDTSFRARVGMAAVHALRGDREEAYRWLQQAIDAGFYPYAELEKHPCFGSLRGEERFRRMMDGVRARVEEVRRGVDPVEPPGVPGRTGVPG